jgi:hypothetical protein
MSEVKFSLENLQLNKLVKSLEDCKKSCNILAIDNAIVLVVNHFSDLYGNELVLKKKALSDYNKKYRQDNLAKIKQKDRRYYLDNCGVILDKRREEYKSKKKK